MAQYDTALRIGFFLEKYPDKIYLHAGTRKGAAMFMKKKITRKCISKEDLLPPFDTSDLTETELEDFFCCFYKEP